MGLIAATAALLGGLAWLAFGFMPIRDGATGAFAAWSQTPARSTFTTRRALPDSSWPMFGASPARTRFVPSELRPPFRLRYSIPGGGGLIEMPPAVSLGRVVFGTHRGFVVASALDDGRELWRTRLGTCIASSPAVRNGIVYLGWAGNAPCHRKKNHDGGVVALSLVTGEVLWKYHTGNVESSPAIVGRTLYFSAFRTRHDSTVYAMQLGPDRRMLCSFDISSKVASSPAVIGKTLYVSAYDRHLYALDASTCGLRWKTSAFDNDFSTRLLLGVRSLVKKGSWTETGYYATPAIAYRRVFLGTIDGVFTAFDAHTGVPRWSRQLGDSIYGSAAIWHEVVYVGTTDGTFYALSARTGRELWKRNLGGGISGSATVTNGRVYVSTFARETLALNARTGAIEWRFPDGRYSPLVVAGKRAVLVGMGKIYGLVNGAAFSTWQAS